MKKPTFLIFSAIAVLSACSPTVANRGAVLDTELFSEIKPGESTREDVAIKLGTPTSISTFDENTWYYIGRQTEQQSFFKPDVLKQQAMEITFDDKGVVTAVNELDLTKAADASPVDRETPTFGQKSSVLKDLLGSLGRPGPSVGNKRGGN